MGPTIKLELPNGWLALVDPCWRSQRRGFQLLGPVPASGGLRPTIAAGYIDAVTLRCTVERGVASLMVLADLSRAVRLHAP